MRLKKKKKTISNVQICEVVLAYNILEVIMLANIYPCLYSLIAKFYDHHSLPRQDIDYILWTGDLPPHDVWNQTREENLKILRDTVNQMTEMFPGIPIFPALGNHESAPVNRYVSD